MRRLIDWIAYLRLMVLYIATIGYVFARNIPGIHLGLMLLVSAVVSGLCISNAHRSGWKKVWPLALCLLYFVPFNGPVSILAYLPLIVLLVRSTWKGLWHTTFDGALTGIKIGIPVYVVMAIFMMPTDMGGLMDLPTRSLPFFALFLSMTFFCIRILRHEDLDMLDRRYVMVNFALVAGVSLLVVLFSSTWFMNILVGLFALIYRYILMPVFAAMLYIIVIIPYAIYLLIRWIGQFGSFDPVSREVEEGAGTVSREVYQMAEEAVGGNLLGTVFRGIAIVVFIVIMVIVIRRMGGSQESTRYASVAMKRESTRKEEKKRRSLFGERDSNSVIRNCYRQFLKLSEKKAIPVDGTLASDRIAARASSMIRSDEPQELRRLWIPIRYGGSSDESAAQEAKELLKAIKRKYKEDLN